MEAGEAFITHWKNE